MKLGRRVNGRNRRICGTAGDGGSSKHKLGELEIKVTPPLSMFSGIGREWMTSSEYNRLLDRIDYAAAFRGSREAGRLEENSEMKRYITYCTR